MKTATRIEKPSIQAVFLISEDAVPVSTAIVIIDATISIRNVKSSKASQNNLKKLGGSLMDLRFVP
jgi:hypothetical protein